MNTSPPKRAQNCPYAPPPMQYGKKSNLVHHEPESPPATENEEKYIQQVLVTFLYYARAIHMTILHTLSAIAPEQAKPTKKILEKFTNYWTI